MKLYVSQSLVRLPAQWMTALGEPRQDYAYVAATAARKGDIELLLPAGANPRQILPELRVTYGPVPVPVAKLVAAGVIREDRRGLCAWTAMAKDCPVIRVERGQVEVVAWWRVPVPGGPVELERTDAAPVRPEAPGQPEAGMTYEQALAWLMSGNSPAGRCTGARARSLLTWARDAGVTHMTLGRDLHAPGRLLTWDGSVFAERPVPDRPVTPWHVSHSMRAAGFTMAGGGRPGWSTFWAHGGDAVRVEWHGHSGLELAAVGKALKRAGWTAELVTETSTAWLRVTQGGAP